MKEKTIRFDQEDPRLVELAIAASTRSLPVGVGTPSPPHSGTSGSYFGAIRILKWLTQEGLIDPDEVVSRLKEPKGS